MSNTFYFLRHGETKKDHDIPISTWILSKKGEEQAQKLAEGNDFDVSNCKTYC